MVEMRGREYKTEERRIRKEDESCSSNIKEPISSGKTRGHSSSNKFRLSFFLYQPNLTGDHTIRKSPGFQPSLYKFIVGLFMT